MKCSYLVVFDDSSQEKVTIEKPSGHHPRSSTCIQLALQSVAKNISKPASSMFHLSSEGSIPISY